MNTFRDKNLKNELNPKLAYYECLRSCEINPESEPIWIEEEDCDTKCLRKLASKPGYKYLKARYFRETNK